MLEIVYLELNKMDKHYRFGKEAEKQAAKYLENNGYEILERNWRFHKFEIDLIAHDLKNDEIIIVEVKARIDPMVDPIDSITKKKIRNLVTAADQYLTENDIEQECRFDIIIIEKKKDKWFIEHIEDAFFATDRCMHLIFKQNRR